MTRPAAPTLRRRPEGLIIGFSGLAGVGKDTAASTLIVSAAFKRMGLADPLKEIARTVFDFTEEQLYGPSGARNRPDRRYPRTRTEAWRIRQIDGDLFQIKGPGEPMPGGLGAHLDAEVTDYLTPREALQKLGTEWGRGCYENVWIDLGMRRARAALATGTPGVVFTDVRFKNEIEGLKAAGAKVVRIKRPTTTLSGAAAMHPSEREQLEIPDSAFDWVIENDGDHRALCTKVLEMLEVFRAPTKLASAAE